MPTTDPYYLNGVYGTQEEVWSIRNQQDCPFSGSTTSTICTEGRTFNMNWILDSTNEISAQKDDTKYNTVELCDFKTDNDNVKSIWLDVEDENNDNDPYFRLKGRTHSVKITNLVNMVPCNIKAIDFRVQLPGEAAYAACYTGATDPSHPNYCEMYYFETLELVNTPFQNNLADLLRPDGLKISFSDDGSIDSIQWQHSYSVMPYLKRLVISDTHMSGALTNINFTRFPHLEHVDLHDTGDDQHQFTGRVPLSLNTDKIIHLDLSGNDLQGFAENWNWNDMESLQYLDISNNPRFDADLDALLASVSASGVTVLKFGGTRAFLSSGLDTLASKLPALIEIDANLQEFGGELTLPTDIQKIGFTGSPEPPKTNVFCKGSMFKERCFARVLKCPVGWEDAHYERVLSDDGQVTEYNKGCDTMEHCCKKTVGTLRDPSHAAYGTGTMANDPARLWDGVTKCPPEHPWVFHKTWTHSLGHAEAHLRGYNSWCCDSIGCDVDAPLEYDDRPEQGSCQKMVGTTCTASMGYSRCAPEQGHHQFCVDNNHLPQGRDYSPPRWEHNMNGDIPAGAIEFSEGWYVAAATGVRTNDHLPYDYTVQAECENAGGEFRHYPGIIGTGDYLCEMSTSHSILPFETPANKCYELYPKLDLLPDGANCTNKATYAECMAVVQYPESVFFKNRPVCGWTDGCVERPPCECASDACSLSSTVPFCTKPECSGCAACNVSDYSDRPKCTDVLPLPPPTPQPVTEFKLIPANVTCADQGCYPVDNTTDRATCQAGVHELGLGDLYDIPGLELGGGCFMEALTSHTPTCPELYAGSTTELDIHGGVLGCLSTYGNLLPPPTTTYSGGPLWDSGEFEYEDGRGQFGLGANHERICMCPPQPPQPSQQRRLRRLLSARTKQVSYASRATWKKCTSQGWGPFSHETCEQCTSGAKSCMPFMGCTTLPTVCTPVASLPPPPPPPPDPPLPSPLPVIEIPWDDSCIRDNPWDDSCRYPNVPVGVWDPWGAVQGCYDPGTADYDPDICLVNDPNVLTVAYNALKVSRFQGQWDQINKELCNYGHNYNALCAYTKDTMRTVPGSHFGTTCDCPDGDICYERFLGEIREHCCQSESAVFCICKDCDQGDPEVCPVTEGNAGHQNNCRNDARVDGVPFTPYVAPTPPPSPTADPTNSPTNSPTFYHNHVPHSHVPHDHAPSVSLSCGGRDTRNSCMNYRPWSQDYLDFINEGGSITAVDLGTSRHCEWVGRRGYAGTEKISIRNTMMGGNFIDSLSLNPAKLTELHLENTEFNGDIADVFALHRLNKLTLKNNIIGGDKHKLREFCLPKLEKPITPKDDGRTTIALKRKHRDKCMDSNHTFVTNDCDIQRWRIAEIGVNGHSIKNKIRSTEDAHHCYELDSTWDGEENTLTNDLIESDGYRLADNEITGFDAFHSGCDSTWKAHCDSACCDFDCSLADHKKTYFTKAPDRLSNCDNECLIRRPERWDESGSKVNAYTVKIEIDIPFQEIKYLEIFSDPSHQEEMIGTEVHINGIEVTTIDDLKPVHRIGTVECATIQDDLMYDSSVVIDSSVPLCAELGLMALGITELTSCITEFVCLSVSDHGTTTAKCVDDTEQCEHTVCRVNMVV